MLEPDLGRELIRIAIANNQRIVLEALALRLGLEPDFEVVGEVVNRSEALHLVQERQPDILLLDVDLPDPEGLAILQHLRAYRLKTRVIVLTNCEDPDRHVQVMRFGASGIVLKQCSTELLTKSIRKVHSGEIWLGQRTMAALMKEFASAGRTAPLEQGISGLSEREQQILELIGQGMRNKQIAEKLFLREQTVKNTLHAVFRKLGVSDRVELAVYVSRSKAAAGSA